METVVRDELERMVGSLRRIGDAVEAIDQGREEVGREEIRDQEVLLRQALVNLPTAVGQRLALWQDAHHGRDLHLMSNWWRYLQEVELLLRSRR